LRKPLPPFLEIGFYHHELAETNAFARLVSASVELGAKYGGEGRAHLGKDINGKPFADTHEELLETLTITNADEFSSYLNASDVRLVQVYMENVTTLSDNATEIITYLSISPDAMRLDHHPIAIWAGGELLSGKGSKRGTMIGHRVCRRFLQLVELLKPDYASITIEYGLECPVDLRHDPRSHAFTDFFISGDYMGIDNLSTVHDIFRGAYIQSLANGLYVSCTRNFNPQGIALEWTDATRRSGTLAKLIASISI